MCNPEHGTRRAHTLLPLRSERSGFYAFYKHHMAGFAMVSAHGKCSAPHYSLRVKFFPRVRHLPTLTRARQLVMQDESLRRQYFRLK